MNTEASRYEIEAVAVVTNDRGLDRVTWAEYLSPCRGTKCSHSARQSRAMLGLSQVYSGSCVVVRYSSSIYYICTMKPGIDDGLINIQRWKGQNSVLFKCISA
ncbi:hypothetical protein J6590_071637 [Homalodisca vitripennis]|nr:hypothetical protein J6590_071637 [Homalodisca vitripennis]